MPKNFIGVSENKENSQSKSMYWVFSPSKVSSIFNHLLKGTLREECFLIEKIDWEDERNEILSLESFETNLESSKSSAGQNSFTKDVPLDIVPIQYESI